MIFITIGTQLPFDRLIRAVDHWAQSRGRQDLFAQVGEEAGYLPKRFAWARSLSAQQFRERLDEASVIVAHAGIGTILSGLELGKPVIVMPRRASLGEHRNEHQAATVDRFARMELVRVVQDADELSACLDCPPIAGPATRLRREGSTQLLECVNQFIEHGSEYLR